MRPAILLVEDESPARAMLRAILTEAGSAVTEVADGGAALCLPRLNLTRKQLHRLVVLLDRASLAGNVTSCLHASADDAQLAVHHAYVLLLPAECSGFQVDVQAGPGLTISALRQPCPPEAMRAVVARAASQLGMGVDGADDEIEKRLHGEGRGLSTRLRKRHPAWQLYLTYLTRQQMARSPWPTLIVVGSPAGERQPQVTVLGFLLTGSCSLRRGACPARARSGSLRKHKWTTSLRGCMGMSCAPSSWRMPRVCGSLTHARAHACRCQ